MKLYVKLLFLVGGWWVVGGSEKNEINAILNSKLKLELVEVGVELGNSRRALTKCFEMPITPPPIIKSSELLLGSIERGMSCKISGGKPL